MTLADLAGAARIGVRTLGDVERGVARRPQRATLEALADALGAGPDERAALLRIGRARAATSSTAPDVVADFTGRDDEVRRIVDRLRAGAGAGAGASAGKGAGAVVVIAGGPGIGKSALAAEALRTSGGRWLHVDLAGQSETPLSALDVVRRLVTLATAGAEEAPTGFDAATARWRELRDAHGHAVLLDDAVDEAQVRSVTGAGGAGGPVVVTSRRLLAGLDADLRITVGPLSETDGTTLLGRMVPDATHDPALRALAGRCAGVPLALRVAGGRIAAPGADVDGFLQAMLAEELRIGALRHGSLSVEAAFSASYRRLPETTARVFRSLAVIDGTTFDARVGGAALGLDEPTAEDALEELVDLGLLEPRGGNRYHVHDLLRAFAADRLTEEDGPAATGARRERLHRSLLATVTVAASRFAPASEHRAAPNPAALQVSADPVAARAWIVTEVDHWWPAFRSSAERDSPEARAEVVGLATGLQWFSNLWPAWGRWYDVFGAAVDAARAIGDRGASSRLLGLQTWAALMERGDRAGALDLATAGLADAAAAGDVAVTANAEYHVAWAHLALRQPLLALPHIDAAIDGNTRAGDDAALVQCRSMAGAALHLLERHDEAIEVFRAVLVDLGRAPAGDPGAAFTRVVALEEIAKSANAIGRWDEAREAAEAGLGAATEMAWDIGAARALRQRAEAALGAGDVDDAAADAQRGIALVDDERADAQAVAVLGGLQELLGRTGHQAS